MLVGFEDLLEDDVAIGVYPKEGMPLTNSGLPKSCISISFSKNLSSERERAKSFVVAIEVFPSVICLDAEESEDDDDQLLFQEESLLLSS